MQVKSDADGDWMLFPDPIQAAAHATPFPETRPTDWRVPAAIHDVTVSHMVRIASAEVSR